MIASAMFLNPTDGPSWGVLVAVVAATGLAIGFAWIRRITSFDEDSKRSFSRLNGRRGGGSKLPAMPHLPRPTGGWLFTRGAIAIGGGSIVAAVIAPLVIRRWDHALELGPVATIVWIAAIAAAVIGTVWMARIALRTPDGGGPSWRYRR